MWSPDGPTPDRITWPGWSEQGPAPADGDTRLGWYNVPHHLAGDDGLGDDLAAAVARLVGRDAGLGDGTATVRPRVAGRSTAIGDDRAILRGRLSLLESATGDDLARIGLRRVDSGLGDDLATARARLAGRDSGIGSDRSAARARLLGRDSGAGGDLAIAAFSPAGPNIATITAVGTTIVPIPVWCRYVDVVLLGAGGGGGGHAGASILIGKGGAAGIWMTATLERGVDFPSLATHLLFTVGNGGSGSTSNGGNGFSGGDTTLHIDDALWLSAGGGSGGLGNQPAPVTGGGSPGNVTYADTTHVGGIGGSGGTGSVNATAGGAPGAGGGGAGGGFINPRREGGAGARGQAWYRARQ
ncbi:hypothetical protein PBI_WHEATTHIN_27 [Gordonia phage WheatThin]|uniref:Glycine-rich domain-containing protein n=2 Tax=Betterkatzvirus betterkatz TaxID=2560485 RepID=A0A2Z5HD89_9CAUD|nr:hypothetical protein SEA_NADEEM_27 [Gordonia phage Nadeem]AZS11195.1 hypothetical protein PBI_WHEATTHIN_27 [Gordonia phage WheatThin]